MHLAPITESDLHEIAHIFAVAEAHLRQQEPVGTILPAAFLRLFDSVLQAPHWGQVLRVDEQIVGAVLASELADETATQGAALVHSLATLPVERQAEFSEVLFGIALENYLSTQSGHVTIRVTPEHQDAYEKAVSLLPFEVRLSRRDAFVEKPLTPEKAQSVTSGTVIRTATEQDRRFVFELTREAFENGRLGDAIDATAAAHALLDHLDGNGVVLIAEADNGEPLGHALLEPYYLDEFRCAVVPHIHDIFVIDSQRDRRISHALGAACEHVVAQTGVTTIRSTVNAPLEKIDALLSSINKTGWQVTESRMRLIRHQSRS